MILNDAVCKDCNEIFTVSKKYMENWSELSFICPKCNSNNIRIKIGFGDMDIALGNHGNGHTGFDKEFTYKPSKYGKFRGKKIK